MVMQAAICSAVSSTGVCGAHPHALADALIRHHVERLGDRDVVVATNLGVGVNGEVVPGLGAGNRSWRSSSSKCSLGRRVVVPWLRLPASSRAS